MVVRAAVQANALFSSRLAQATDGPWGPGGATRSAVLIRIWPSRPAAPSCRSKAFSAWWMTSGFALVSPVAATTACLLHFPAVARLHAAAPWPASVRLGRVEHDLVSQVDQTVSGHVFAGRGRKTPAPYGAHLVGGQPVLRHDLDARLLAASLLIAETFRIPFSSIRNVTRILGIPAGMGGSPRSSNSPSERQSRANSRSPWQALILRWSARPRTC